MADCFDLGMIMYRCFLHAEDFEMATESEEGL